MTDACGVQMLRISWYRCQPSGCLVGCLMLLAGCGSSTEQTATTEVARAGIQQQQKSHLRIANSAGSGTRSKTVGLPFTVDAFCSKVSGLKHMKSLGEFRETQKFSVDFDDGEGTITGEYLKKGRKLLHLIVTGHGSTWSGAIGAACALSTSDKDNFVKLMDRLMEAENTDSKVETLDLNFQFMHVGNEKALVVSNPNDKQPTPEEMRKNYVAPTVGISLVAFKESFNKRMSSISPALKLKGPGEETTSPAYFQYMFTPDTVLSVNADETSLIVQDIELDSVPKDAVKFWQCTDAIVCALNPNSTADFKKDILAKLSGGDRNSLPSESIDFENGQLAYSYMKMKYAGGCALTIQSNKP